MELLYLADRLSDRGGADHHLAQVVGDAVDAGSRVTVAFGRDEGGWPHDDGVRLRRVRGLATRIDSGARLAGLDELMDNADAIHVQNVLNPTVLAAAAARRRTVVTVQDHRFFCPGAGKTMPDGTRCASPMADAACRVCLPDVDYRKATLELTGRRLQAISGARVVVLSRYMASELDRAGCPGAVALPPWVEVGRPRSGTGSTLLLGGRLVTHKGVLDGWRAWDAAGRPLPLEVAGDGPLAPELEGAERLGWLDAAGLRAALRRARALIFPAGWQEPFGILGVEALAEGTPVVVAPSGGTSEWSVEGCIEVPAGDVEAMAHAIRDLADDPDLALELGRRGREAVRRRFDRGAIASRLEAIYREVAAASSTLR